MPNYRYRTSRPYGLYTTMDFGKHRGETMQQIICEHPSYIAYLLDTVDGFCLDEEATRLFEDRYYDED